MLIWCAQGPEGNWASSELGKPAFQFGLGGVVRQTVHVEDFATFFQESIYISSGIHGASQDIRMLVNGLRLPNKTSQNPGKRNCLFHGTTRGGRRQRLQVEGQVVLDWCRRLHRFHFQGSTNVREGTGAKGQGLWMMLLPSGVL